jgi:C1A family cysteine protease/uncharacterized protein YjdB
MKRQNTALKPAAFFLSLLFMLSISSGLCLPETAYAKGELSYKDVSPYVSEFQGKPEGENNYGYIPSSINLVSLGVPSGASASAWEDSLPKKYNADPTKVKYQTAIKNQLGSGPCWAFSALAALESGIMLKNNGAQYNFSERNMMNNHGLDYRYFTGGNREMALAYLTRWDGPVDEKDDYPYGFDGTTVGVNRANVRKHVQDAVYLPDVAHTSAKTVERDIAAIKRAVREYGAVSTSFYYGDAYYNAKKQAYYCSASKKVLNHAVTIVGWDDSYSKNNFKKRPEKNGAFLVKNSWGKNFGKKGYFYVSYYDKYFGTDNYAYTSVESVYNYDAVQQYDELGCIDALGSRYARMTWGYANVFPSPADPGTLNAVAFYTTAPGASYEVYLDKNADPPNFTGLVRIASGTQKYAGYHTVKLSAPSALDTSGSYAVVVKVTNPAGYSTSNFPVPMEYAYAGYSANANASPGQSYVMLEGSNWTDITTIASNEAGTEYNYKNVCLKAFTRDTLRPAGITLDKQAVSLYRGARDQLLATVAPADARNKEVVWSSSNEAVAAVGPSGEVTGVAPGTAIITAMTKMAGITTQCTVAVYDHVSGVTVSPAWCQLNAGLSRKLTPTVLPAAALDKSVAWSSGDPAVATVDASGNVTAVAPGTAVITATTADGGFAASGAVEVVPASRVTKPVASNVTRTGLRLAWRRPNLSGSVKYFIEQSASAVSGFKKVADTKKLYADIAKLKKNTTYYFRIRAKTGSGYGEFSAVLAVKTKK